MITFLKGIFSFKGSIAKKPFFKKLLLFFVVYIILATLRFFIFYTALAISDNHPNHYGPEHKMKPLIDALFAWLIAFIATHIPYSVALIALMVRRMNDTKIWSGFIVIINVAWFIANIVLIISFFSTNLFDLLMPTLLGFNVVTIFFILMLLSQPSIEDNQEKERTL